VEDCQCPHLCKMRMLWSDPRWGFGCRDERRASFCRQRLLTSLHVPLDRWELKCHKDVPLGFVFPHLHKVCSNVLFLLHSHFGWVSFMPLLLVLHSSWFEISRGQGLTFQTRPSHCLWRGTVSQYWRMLERRHWNNHAFRRHLYSRMHVLCRQYCFHTTATRSFWTIQGMNMILYLIRVSSLPHTNINHFSCV
jgi:hypothetical protein